MRLEPREAVPLAVTLGYPALAIAVALIFCAALVALSGASPFSTFYLVAKGAAGSQFALFETLTRATPLIFTGLAAATAFRAKLWNIGAEAQLYVGAIATVVLGTGLLPWPPYLLVPILMIAAMLGGALTLLGPAVTGKDHRAQIVLPEGFEFRVAEMASADIDAEGPDLAMSHSKVYGALFHAAYGPHGLIDKPRAA